MKFKKILSLVLAVITVMSVVQITAISAFAANYTANYSQYDQPENSGDYAYWNGKKTERSKSTNINEVKWIQSSLNWCISNKGVNASKLNVDGSFGPASKKATIAFQKKFGLSADGSFGPSTIKKMKSVLSSGSSKSASSSTSSSKTLSFNMNNIKSTGPQPKGSKYCGCFALAYARDILDGKSHKYSEYSEGYLKKAKRYSYTVVWAKGNATSKKGSSKQDVFKAAYNAINSGKPVIVRVTGNGSSGHYITLVGYKDVKNVNSLAASNFLMIDPVSSLFNKGVVSMTAGSTGYSLASNLQYIIVN